VYEPPPRDKQSNSLPVGEINDDQQRNDGRAYGNDILDPKKPERNQQAESRFRPVRGGAESIQTKNRNALRGTDLFGAFVGGLNGLANKYG
jgi:hypothetical protein